MTTAEAGARRTGGGRLRRLNPFGPPLVREMRTLPRSAGFFVVRMVLLLAAAAVAVVGLAQGPPQLVGLARTAALAGNLCDVLL